MKRLFPLHSFAEMLSDHHPREVRFDYSPAGDERLSRRVFRTEWEKYLRNRLFGAKGAGNGRLRFRSVGIIGDFNGWGPPVAMKRTRQGYRAILELGPGLYHYQFVLRLDIDGAGAVAIDDPGSDGDLSIPDLSRPGLRKSGILVLPEFRPARDRKSAAFTMECLRARMDRLEEGVHGLRVAVPASEVSGVRAVVGDWSKELDLIDEEDGFRYFHALLENPAAGGISIRLLGPAGAMDTKIGEGGRLAPDPGGRLENAISGSFAPRWAKSAVWYTLLPDRFRHSSPDPDTHRKANETWRKDWYSLQPSEKEFYPDIYFRKYGGNLAGIIEKLPYLRDLGINALCLTPVFCGGSYHKYDTLDLRHIDPDFGPDPDGDRKALAEAGETLDPGSWIFTQADLQFLELMRKAHAAGIRIVIDGVFSHVGDGFWAFRDVREKGKRSPFFRWFWIKGIGRKPAEGRYALKYESFFGMSHLPKLRWNRMGLDPGVERHIFDITSRWMRPRGPESANEGVDGWRLDVANELPMGFWRRWRSHVKSLNPEAVILGEMLGTAYEPYLDGRTLDSIINYRFGALAMEFFVNDRNAASPRDMGLALLRMKAGFRESSMHSMQNVLDSHDLDRIVSGIRNRNRPYGSSNKIQYAHHSYDGSRPNEIDYRILRMLIAFQVLCVGAPHLLYGTEAGMWGSTDPHCRKPMVWEDLGEYEPECCSFPAHQGYGLSLDVPVFDGALHRDISSLLKLRSEYPELVRRRGILPRDLQQRVVAGKAGIRSVRPGTPRPARG
jgi:glycosidase